MDVKNKQPIENKSDRDTKRYLISILTYISDILLKNDHIVWVLTA